VIAVMILGNRIVNPSALLAKLFEVTLTVLQYLKINMK